MATNMNARMSINSSAGFGLLALGVTAVVVLSGLAAVISSAFGSGVGNAEPEQELTRLVAKHDEAMKTWQDQFNGRSVFFKPPAPQPPYVAPPPPPDPLPSAPVQPAGPDPVYRGPSVNFAYGDTVYFTPIVTGDKFTRLRIGDEKGDLKVLATNLPWSVRVAYKGGEYDVPLFTRTDESVFISTAPKPVLASNFLVPVTSASTSPDIPTSNAAAISGDVPAADPRRSARTDRRAIEAVPRARPQAEPEEPAPPVVEDPADDPVVDDDVVDVEPVEVDPDEGEPIEETPPQDTEDEPGVAGEVEVIEVPEEPAPDRQWAL